MRNVRRVAIVLNDDFSLWHFFQGLLRALVSEGYEVYVLTPAGPYTTKLEALGTIHIPTPLRRFVDPWGDLRYCLNLARIFRKNHIDLVCNITIKPIVYGALAARLARVPRIVGMIEGLGYTLSKPVGTKAWVSNLAARLLYRLGCRLSHRVGFSNPDDLELFVARGFIAPARAVPFRSMVGVDVNLNSPASISRESRDSVRTELKIAPARVVVLMITRVVWSKGVKEFVEASELARHWPHPPIFVLVGPVDPGAVDSVPPEFIKGQAPGMLLWLDTFRQDIAAMIAMSDIVVLPSYYREGVPRILLEGLAFGKPVVTTDHVGCRETVQDGHNGFLVPVKDTPAFAGAVLRLVQNHALRMQFGRNSRLKAEGEFEETKVIRSVMTRLFELKTDASPIPLPAPAQKA